jgi:hypothetical protein
MQHCSHKFAPRFDYFIPCHSDFDNEELYY